MKIVEICEAIDQREADEVLKALVASGDPSAKYFQQTRYNPVHTTIDSAQRAAERMWHNEQRKKEKQSQEQPTPVQKTSTVSPKRRDVESEPKKQREPADWGDRFYGNQYTGSRGLGIDVDFDQQGLRTIGKGINAVKKAFSPVSSIAKAFSAGMQKAPAKK